MTKRDEYISAATIAILVIICVSLMLRAPADTGVGEYKVSQSVATLLGTAYNSFAIPKKGIIHIGAHYAEELPIYNKFAVKNKLWIEADPTAADQLRSAIANDHGSRMAIFAASDQTGTANFYRTTKGGGSSSMLRLNKHLIMDPTIQNANVVQVERQRLDDFMAAQKDLKRIGYNVLVMDIQGSELIALRGAVNTLKQIDAIISEVNYDELYTGGVLIQELDDFLRTHDFVRLDAITIDKGFGDALYIKTKFCMY